MKRMMLIALVAVTMITGSVAFAATATQTSVLRGRVANDDGNVFLRYNAWTDRNGDIQVRLRPVPPDQPLLPEEADAAQEAVLDADLACEDLIPEQMAVYLELRLLYMICPRNPPFRECPCRLRDGAYYNPRTGEVCEIEYAQ